MEKSADEIDALADRIGATGVREVTGGSAIVRWQAVLTAALGCDDGYKRFLDEVLGTLPKASHKEILEAAPFIPPELEREARDGQGKEAPGGQEKKSSDGQGKLGTACQELAHARTRNEMKAAAGALRDEVLQALATITPGGERQLLPMAAATTGDAENVAERLGILGMNVLTVVDRLLELTENPNASDGPVAGSELFLPETIDGLMAGGAAIGAPASEQTMHLARNARSATWLHAWRFMSALRKMSPIYPGSRG